ncbi:MAG: epimerase [Chitinophagaceae bacterium]|nr:epimerase [Rubrivivax sp.]
MGDTDALLTAWLGTTAARHIPRDHAAPRALVHAVNPAYTRWDAEALPALQAGLRLARHAKAHFMLPGNVYNFGEAMPPLLAEDTPFRPSNAKGRLRVEMEAQAARAAQEGAFTASVIRSGDFLGPGTGAWLDQAIVKSLRAGKLVYPGPLHLPHAWAYLPDLARAFVRVAPLANAQTFQNWHFEGYTLTGAELLDAIEAAAGSLGAAPASGFHRGGMPWGLIAAIGLVYPLWRELAGMSYLWRVPHALEGRHLAALMAGSPAVTPLPLALRDCLSALGHGALATPVRA